jgi:hypothetical protein
MSNEHVYQAYICTTQKHWGLRVRLSFFPQPQSHIQQSFEVT